MILLTLVKFCMFSNIVKIVFFFSIVFLRSCDTFVMCVIVVCDDLVMSGVFPVEDFNRYVVVSVEETALMC